MDAVALQIIEQHVRNGVCDRGIADEHNGVGVCRCLHVQLFQQRDEVVVALTAVICRNQRTEIGHIPQITQFSFCGLIAALEPRSTARQSKVAHIAAGILFAQNIDAQRCACRNYLTKTEGNCLAAAFGNGNIGGRRYDLAAGIQRAQSTIALKTNRDLFDLNVAGAVSVRQLHLKIPAGELGVHLDTECCLSRTGKHVSRII